MDAEFIRVMFMMMYISSKFGGVLLSCDLGGFFSVLNLVIVIADVIWCTPLTHESFHIVYPLDIFLRAIIDPKKD